MAVCLVTRPREAKEEMGKGKQVLKGCLVPRTSWCSRRIVLFSLYLAIEPDPCVPCLLGDTRHPDPPILHPAAYITGTLQRLPALCMGSTNHSQLHRPGPISLREPARL